MLLRTSIRFVILLLLPTWAAAAGRSPLADAAREGDVKALRALLQQRVDVNAPEPDGSTALHWAADRGDATAVDLLLRAGARATTANRYGVTPLTLAAASGSAAVVDRLIKNGANPNTAVYGGETALMTAARAGNVAAVRTLIEAGADVKARETTRGQTALHWAAAEGHTDVIRVLLAHGADIKATSHGPSSPKEVSAGDFFYKRPSPRLDVFTALQFAVRAGHTEATRALLDAGADIADETSDGMGLITLTIVNGSFDVAALLIEKGADVNDAKVGWTPLHQLVRVGTTNIGWGPPRPQSTGRTTKLDLAKMLLAHGADIEARTKKGWQDGYRGGFGLNATPFLLAAKGGDAELMLLLAVHGADITATNANGTSAVMAAAGVEMFNPNEDSGRDADGLAALKLAVRLGAGELNATNKQGTTALHGAIGRISPEFAKVLAESGARLDLKDKKGMMPIEIALAGVSVAGGVRLETAQLLGDLMHAQGLTPPELTVDKERYRFGVESAK